MPGNARAGTPTEQKPAIQSTHPYDIYWQDGPDLRGVYDKIYTSIVYDGLFIAGGNFDAAGDAIAQRIAAWDGTNNAGNPVATGVYFYRLRAGKVTLTKKNGPAEMTPVYISNCCRRIEQKI